MIPRLVPRRFAFGHFKVPFFCSLKSGINIHDNSPVIKPKMVNDLSYAILAGCVHLIIFEISSDLIKSINRSVRPRCDQKLSS